MNKKRKYTKERPKRTLQSLKRFEVDFGEGVVGAVMHDLPDIFGMSIDCALPNYVVRTTRPTLKGFCDYVLRKQPDCIAYPEKKNEKEKQAV